MAEHLCAFARRSGDAWVIAVAPRLFGFVKQLVGDRALAEDILQETLLKLHEARGFYVRGADPVPWMFTIARHTAFDELRKKKRARVRLGHLIGGHP